MTARTGEDTRDRALPRPPSRRIAATLLRLVGSIVGLTALYYVMPLDHSTMAFTLTMLLIGLAGFLALVGFEVRWIIRSRYPGLRAVEALAMVVPFFLLLFASTYVALANLAPDSFGGHLTHTEGIYFTVTVFSTVGFGDITAKSDTARVVVTIQMLADLIIYGVAIKVFVRAVQQGRQRIAGPGRTDAGPGRDE